MTALSNTQSVPSESTVASWLRTASETLADALLPSPRLDAEIILAHTINRPRTWLHAHGNEPLDPRRVDIADARIALRLDRVPVAYIIGHKEFYGRRFVVTPDVLIPRPESEALIELLLAHAPDTARRVVDVGCGSGCLGITAKCERPDLEVTLLDISATALAITQKNADRLQVTIRTARSDLLSAYPLNANIVLANLPYVDSSWPEITGDLSHEPATALFADDNGLALYKRFFAELPAHCAGGALVVIEADPRQHDALQDIARGTGFSHRVTKGFALAFVKQ